MKGRILLLLLAFFIAGRVAYGSRHTTDETARISPLFSTSVNRSIAEVSGAIPKRLSRSANLKSALVGVAYYQDTAQGPTCDFSLCPNGCNRGMPSQAGDFTCRVTCSGTTYSGGTCDSSCGYTFYGYTCNGSNTCAGGYTCGSNTCWGTTCDGTPWCQAATADGTTCANAPTCDWMTCHANWQTCQPGC